MALNIILVILGVLLFLAAFALIRTMLYSRPLEPVKPIEPIEVNADEVAEHLAIAIQCETVSTAYEDAPAEDAFLMLHRKLVVMFPKVHTHLKLEKINNFSLLYTWPGSEPELDGVLFAAHLDVVPADPATLEAWTYPPLSGQIADGYVWGRGTLDNKNQLITTLEAVEALLQQGFAPRRTVYLAYGHDEEIGGKRGASAIVEHLAQQEVRLAGVIDEGGMIVNGSIPGVSIPSALVGYVEKGFMTLELSVESPPGHSAMPPKQTAIGILAAALAKLEANPMRANTGPSQLMLRELAPVLPFSMQVALANMWLAGGIVKSRLASVPATNATIRSTTAVTMISGGIKDNILPRLATAKVNFRILPGDTIAGICDHVRKVVNDERVKLHAVAEGSWEASPSSALEGPVYDALRTTIRQFFNGVPVSPFLVVGATDSRYYYKVCENVYRFTPDEFSTDVLPRVHGINERVPVESLGRMVQFFAQLMKVWAEEL